MPKRIMRIRRRESGVCFRERVAETMALYDSVDFGLGPMCRNCAPFGDPEVTCAEITPFGASCYNCGMKHEVK